MTTVGFPISKPDTFSEDTFYNQALLETENFKVIPSLGSLVPGWVMVIPKEYYISFGAINNLSILKELNYLIDSLGSLIKSHYGDYIMFEHGPVAKKSLVGCSVDYAHLHLVPVSINLIEESKVFLTKKVLWSPVSGIGNTVEYYYKKIPYLFVRDLNSNSFIGTSEELPSQLFRKTIALHLGIKDMYDWKQHPFKKNIIKTVDTLSDYKEKLSHFQSLYHHE